MARTRCRPTARAVLDAFLASLAGFVVLTVALATAGQAILGALGLL